MAHQFVFTLKDLRKIVPPKREILRGIWLSFYPGAKIGVLGSNGAGKSTLLRIMAGVDQDFLGDVWRAPDLKIGHLPQEPVLDPAKDVRGNVEEGVAEVRGLLTRFDEINARLGEPIDGDEMEKLLEEQAQVAGRHRGAERLGSRSHGGDRDGRPARARRRPGRGDRSPAASAGAWRSAGCSCPSPTCSLLDEPTNHLDAESVAWLERYPEGVPGHRGRHHPRPLLPRQCRGLDPRARPRRRHPVGGQLLLLAGAEEGAAGGRGEAGVGAAAHARARAGVGAHGAAGAARQVQGAASRRTRASSRRAASDGRAPPRSSSPTARGWATSSSRPRSS